MDALYDKILGGDFDFAPNPRLSHGAKDLVCALLRSPPEERSGASSVAWR